MTETGEHSMKSTEMTGTTGPFITIVSGLPRSGTSMMMQLLAAGGVPALADDIRAADDDNPRGYYEFERVKQIETDSSWLDEAEGKAVKMVYRLLYDLPADREYRVIFMIRSLDEVIASQRVMLERSGQADTQLDDTRLAQIYRRQLQAVKDWLHAQANFSVIEVDYHEVLNAPKLVVEQLNHFLDGRLDVDAALQIPDSSLYRQRSAAPAAAGMAQRD
jgi:hypothetical protein